MRQNEYYTNPNGFADPNDKFVCYSHRTKKVTVHCADGSTHPSHHTYETIKQIIKKCDHWQKIDYKTAYSMLKPLDKTEILHYYVPTTKNPRNVIKLISCNKTTKKTTVYYKNGSVEERDNYVKCGKLKLITKQEALNILKNIDRCNLIPPPVKDIMVYYVHWVRPNTSNIEIISYNMTNAMYTIYYKNGEVEKSIKCYEGDKLKQINQTEALEIIKNINKPQKDEIIYYGPDLYYGDDWNITAYVEYNKTKKEVIMVAKNGEVFEKSNIINAENIENKSISKDWKIITQQEAFKRVKG